MTQTKHTPGPWIVHQYRHQKYNGKTDVGPNGIAVCTVLNTFEAERPTKETEANARLIAAAPDMYSGADRLIQALSMAMMEGLICGDLHASIKNQWQALGDAIAKAKGGAA